MRESIKPTKRELKIARLTQDLIDAQKASKAAENKAEKDAEFAKYGGHRKVRVDASGDLLVAPRDEPETLDFSCNEAELMFVRRAKEKGLELSRNGWPDFLLRSASTAAFAVEVKAHGDRLSARQKHCFAMLEEAGIRVYVWRPRVPKLVPWRKFAEEIAERDESRKRKRIRRWTE